jgi:putative glycosyltransferase (TIGR04372 family)
MKGNKHYKILLSEFFESLKNKNLKIILKYVFHLFFVIIFSPVSLTIYLIRPIIKIRINPITTVRIGHFANDLDFALIKKQEEKKEGIHRVFDLWFTQEIISNKFLMKYMKQKILVIPRIIGVSLNFFFELESKNAYNRLITRPSDEFISKDIKKYAPLVVIEESDQNICRSILASHNISLNSKIALICVRDSKYLNDAEPDQNWEYHSYRDSDIDDYKLGIEYLIERGYQVFRMGRESEKRLQLNNISFIDYPFCDFKSDMMDFYLFSKAEFVISTAFGIDSIGTALRKNIFTINYLPIYDARDRLMIEFGLPKNLKLNNQYVKIEELLELGAHTFYSSSDYSSSGLNIENCTPVQIKEFFVDVDKYMNMDANTEKREILVVQEKLKLINNRYFSTKWKNL